MDTQDGIECAVQCVMLKSLPPLDKSVLRDYIELVLFDNSLSTRRDEVAEKVGAAHHYARNNRTR